MEKFNKFKSLSNSELKEAINLACLNINSVTDKAKIEVWRELNKMQDELDERVKNTPCGYKQHRNIS